MLSALSRGSVASRSSWMRPLSSVRIVVPKGLDKKVFASISNILKHLQDTDEYKLQAKEIGVDSQNWTSFTQSQCDLIVNGPEHYFHDPKEYAEFKKHVSHLHTSKNRWVIKKASDFLVKILLKKAEESLSSIIVANKTLQTSHNLSSPMYWFPMARMMKRKVIYHGGPTNSGKVRKFVFASIFFLFFSFCELFSTDISCD